jgi:Nucleotide-diphospho-sugar transferase
MFQEESNKAMQEVSIYLQSRLEDISGESILWITMVNEGYLDYANNFITAIEIGHLEELPLNILFFCLDDTSYQFINERTSRMKCFKSIKGLPILKDRGRNYNGICSEFQVWNTELYKNIMFAKLDFLDFTFDCMKQFLLITSISESPFEIGYMDLDIVLFKNPTTFILNQMKICLEASLFAQCDENYLFNIYQCSKIHKCPNICAGFMVFRFRDHDKFQDTLFKYQSDVIQRYMNADQEYLNNRIVSLHNFKYMTLNRTLFLNGTYKHIYLNNQIIDLPPNEDTILIHFNYIIGQEKREIMRNQKMWFI